MGNAWQMFAHKEKDEEHPSWDSSLVIDETSCPTDYAGWTFNGNFVKDLKARELTVEEAKEENICTPQNYWTYGQKKEDIGNNQPVNQPANQPELKEKGDIGNSLTTGRNCTPQYVVIRETSNQNTI